MAAVIHLDTHVLVWLYSGDMERLGPVLPLLQRHQMVASPMAVLELQYLFEVGRTTESAELVAQRLQQDLGLHISSAPWGVVVGHALQLDWTKRDPFDRLIVATAVADDAPLLTKDTLIQKNFPEPLGPHE
jgi:PIN domain nuclease of toxin-antitoxin system